MSKTTIIILVLIIIAGGIFLFSGDKDSVTTPAVDEGDSVVDTTDSNDEKRIVIQGHKIPSEPLVVTVGTTVVFENKDSFDGLPYNRHTITTGTVDESGASGVSGVVPNSGSGTPDGLINASLDTNGEFSFTFDEPGSYTFYIAEHPNVSGQGSITINAVEETAVESNVISMESESFSFSPNTIEAKIGEEINIDITSTGLHTFTIDELGVDIQTPHGETTRVSFTPDKTGTFTYYCAIPGHKEAGQVGTLVVE